MSTSSTVYWPPAPEPFPPLDQQHPHPHQQQQQQQSQSYYAQSLPQSQHPQQQQQHPQQQQLQLEHHLDALGSFVPAFYPPALPQANTTSPSYTATALAANGAHPASSSGVPAPAGAFVFGKRDTTTTSPEAHFGGFQFGAAAVAGSSSGAGNGVGRDGVPPHERVLHQQAQTLQSPPINLGMAAATNTEYLHPGGYVPQQLHPGQGQPHATKRRRADDAHVSTSPGSGWSASGSGAGSGPEDDEHDPEQDEGGYDDFAAEYAQYGTGAAAPYAAQGYAVPGQQGFPFDAGFAQGQGPPMSSGQMPGVPMGPDGKPKQVHRPACVRCKNLKVRCEFPPGTAPTAEGVVCRRCTSGGHKCEIPGRKKRRQPPKREFLLNQIREQAEEIQRLMGMLEGYRHRAMRDEPIRLSLSNTPLHATGSGTPAPGQQAPAAAAAGGGGLRERDPPPDVQAWIEQARLTIEAFGGLIDEGAFAAVADADAEADLEDTDTEADGSTFEGEDDEEHPNREDAYEADADEHASWDSWQANPAMASSPPPPTSSSAMSDSGISGTSAPSSPAPTVRSASREGSAAPTAVSASGSSGSGSQRGGSAGARSRGGSRGAAASASAAKRKTPQATLPTTTAAPFGLIAQLASAAEGAASAKGKVRRGSRSPKIGRGGSVEMEVVVVASSTSPGEVREEGVEGGEEGEADVQVTVREGSETEGEGEGGRERRGTAYGAAAPGFFAPLPRASMLRSSSVKTEGEGASTGGAAGDEDQDGGSEETKREGAGGLTKANALAPPGSGMVPHILARGVVSPKEVEDLFEIYFEKMNLSCSLLDPVLYTAKTTYWRSPFLFTVICAIASRYYAAGRPGLYEDVMTYAQLAAGTALISGPKTVETVAAYILLSLYPLPKRRWEEDRTWLYLGLAIRVATDLNLHTTALAPPSGTGAGEETERHARERLNRARVWLNCYNLDRSTASWHGKASTISSRDFLAAHAEGWYNASPYNLSGFDVQLAAYNAELRHLGEFAESIHGDPENPTGLAKDKDISALASAFDERLLQQEAAWNERLARETDVALDAQARFRNSLVKLAYRYARLTVLSFGFQHAFVGLGSAVVGTAGTGEEAPRKGERRPFFERCYRAATEVVRVFIDELSSQTVYLRHGPEAQCVFVTFASAFLIKLLHPKYASYLTPAQRREIDTLVRGIVALLSSEAVAVDEKHSPRLWARFLEGLLATPMARVELSPSAATGSSPGAKRRGQKASASASAREKDGKGRVKEGAQSVEKESKGGGDPVAQTQNQSQSQSHPQSSFNDVQAHAGADVYDSASGFFDFGQQRQQQQQKQQHPQGIMGAYDASGRQSSSHPQAGAGAGADGGMYGFGSPLSSPLSMSGSGTGTSLTSPALSSGVPVGAGTGTGTGGSMDTNFDSFDSSMMSSGANFDSPMNAGVAGTGTIAPNALQMHVPDFYQPPVPLFDSDLLASMQAMQDPSVWQDMPGYNWMSTLQTSDVDATMQDGGSLLPSGNGSGGHAMGGFGADAHFATSVGPPF